MRFDKKHFGFIGLLGALALAATGCPGENNGDTDGGNGDDGGGGGGFEQPADTVAINFSIDATGRAGFYEDGDLEWKGNFMWDDATRMIAVDSTWAGPFPPLYDDGPWNAGGHEPAGETAGDDVFGITVFFPTPTEPVTLEYGAQTSDGGWIWVGGNGSVIVPAGATDPITAEGMTLAPAGDRDLRLTLDTNNLLAGFAGDEPITVKGTFSAWAEEPTFDDGTNGDATAGDGIYTYTLSDAAAARLLLQAGTVQEWVWVINLVEYKDGSGDAAMDGVAAYTKAPADADFTEQTVVLADNGNTSITIP